MTVLNSPFKSKFGFTSSGFIVDELGNISAKSIILVDAAVPDPELPADYTFTEVSNNFRNSLGVNNPQIIVFRGKTVAIDITLSSITFNIVTADKTTFFSTGLTHDSGTSGNAAQGKSSGRIAWAVPITAPDTLYYADASGTIFGTINVSNPPSAFSAVQVTGTDASTSSSTGALTVAGGLGVAGDLYVGGTLNIDGLGITSISSPTDLQLEAANNIILKIDGTTLGVVTATGSSVPVVSTSINNTVIGALPTNNAEVTNKQYVDSTALSLSIAFGL
jgi:hypothetical protein